MNDLTWTGDLAFLNPILAVVAIAVGLCVLASIAAGFVVTAGGSGNVATVARGPADYTSMALNWALYALIAVLAAYLVGGLVLPDPQSRGIIGQLSFQFLPVWIALVAVFVLSNLFKAQLGLWGKLMNSTIGSIGAAIVLFWVFTAFFADMVITHDPLSQVSGMKNKVPGTNMALAEPGVFEWYLLGGDNLARDVFSRVVAGSWEVMKIAPVATLFAFMVGITLGVPAGYYGGYFDTALSFVANLILAFPVILLFYLLVTPEIVDTGMPSYLAAVLFLFPIIFLVILFNSKFHTQPRQNTIILSIVLVGGGWLYLSLISEPGGALEILPPPITLFSTSWFVASKEGVEPLAITLRPDLFDVPGNVLIVFVSVVFVNSPTVFRIVRGIVLDIKTRDYVAAAYTRGEGPWYTMLWEILPNARGPLIVDFCLRIGYTTILLGTLGFFGLGLEPESPDWGSTINDGRRLLSIYPHPALPPAFALMSLVLGLNLLADGLREESLKD